MPNLDGLRVAKEKIVSTHDDTPTRDLNGEGAEHLSALAAVFRFSALETYKLMSEHSSPSNNSLHTSSVGDQIRYRSNRMTPACLADRLIIAD